MKWLSLDLGSVAEIDTQAEESINTLRALCEQHRTASSQPIQPHQPQRNNAVILQLQKAIYVLRSAMATRITALDAFYHENDLDPRAARLEGTRLRMKKALRDMDIDANSGSSSNNNNAAAQQLSVSARAAAAAPSLLGGRAGAATPSRLGGGAAASGVAGTAAASAVRAAVPETMVQVRILMTPLEYEELRRRRDVMRAAHVRASEHIGGATISVNGPGSLLYNPTTNHNNNNFKVSSPSAARQGGSLSWEHAAEQAQRRPGVAPPIVRASGAYSDVAAPLPRSTGRTSLSIAQPKFIPNFEMNRPSPRMVGRYASPRVASTGGARAVAGPYISAPPAGLSTSQSDKLRSFVGKS